jgi:DNA-binding IclR family transcriptional regulator
MDKTVKAQGQRGIQSIEVGFRLIRVLETATGKLPLKTLADLAEMPASNAHLYMVSFCRVGLAVQDPITLRYGLGPYAVQVGLSALRQLDVVDVARGPMENMQVEIPLAVYLSIWGNMGPTIILKLDGRFQSPMSVRVGYVSPLLSSATGAVYLTFMPEHEIEKVLAREIRELDDRKADVDEIRAQVKLHGIGVSIGRMNEGYAAVSAPVLNHDDRLVASITALGPHSLVDRSPDGPLAASLRAAAAEIASALGQQRVPTLAAGASDKIRGRPGG